MTPLARCHAALALSISALAVSGLNLTLNVSGWVIP